MYTNRNEIPEKYKWDLSVIFPDVNAFEEAYERCSASVKAFSRYRAVMTKSAGDLLSCLSEYTEIRRCIDRLYEYAGRNSDLDLSDNKYQSLVARVRLLANDFESVSFFVQPALIKIPSKKLSGWFLENAELKKYERMIFCIRRYRKHTLPDKQEKIVADLSKCLYTHGTVRSVFANADLQFDPITDENGKKVPLSDTLYISYMMNPNRSVRRSAFRTLYKTYAQYGNTFAGLLDGFVRERTTIAGVRHFSNSLEASVFDDEVTSSIYNNLVATVRTHLEPLFRYYALKKKLLGVPQLHLYDIYTPMITAKTREYTFEEAVDMVLDALKVYGKEYCDTLKEGLTARRWVDVYPTPGKRGGAYSAGTYDTEPYILLNFNGTFDNVSTLAHEAGHSMHSYFSRSSNLPHDSEYTIFVAEVASTVNELLLAHHLLKNSGDPEEKLSILDELMSTFKGTLYRQTMFAEFEQIIHSAVEAGEPLTKDTLCEKYYRLNQHYFGKDVVCDREIRLEWMRIPHFYYNFYVYKYATCISAASAIVKKIETEGEQYVKKYIAFLSCGNSRSPLESLALADIDMNDPSVILSAIEDFGNTVSEFERILESQKK